MIAEGDIIIDEIFRADIKERSQKIAEREACYRYNYEMSLARINKRLDNNEGAIAKKRYKIQKDCEKVGHVYEQRYSVFSCNMCKFCGHGKFSET